MSFCQILCIQVEGPKGSKETKKRYEAAAAVPVVPGRSNDENPEFPGSDGFFLEEVWSGKR